MNPIYDVPPTHTTHALCGKYVYVLRKMNFRPDLFQFKFSLQPPTIHPLDSDGIPINKAARHEKCFDFVLKMKYDGIVDVITVRNYVINMIEVEMRIHTRMKGRGGMLSCMCSICLSPQWRRRVGWGRDGYR